MVPTFCTPPDPPPQYLVRCFLRPQGAPQRTCTRLRVYPRWCGSRARPFDHKAVSLWAPPINHRSGAKSRCSSVQLARHESVVPHSPGQPRRNHSSPLATERAPAISRSGAASSSPTGSGCSPQVHATRATRPQRPKSRAFPTEKGAHATQTRRNHFQETRQLRSVWIAARGHCRHVGAGLTAPAAAEPSLARFHAGKQRRHSPCNPLRPFALPRRASLSFFSETAPSSADEGGQIPSKKRKDRKT
jgi:hypothetical protein